MDDLFAVLSSSARLDKRSTNKNPPTTNKKRKSEIHDREEEEDGSSSSDDDDLDGDESVSGDDGSSSNNKRNNDQMKAFRRSVGINITNKSDHPSLPHAIPSFKDLSPPVWWFNPNQTTTKNINKSKPNYEGKDCFFGMVRPLQQCIEQGRWKEPTPIQMQSIPILMDRMDLLGQACTGSGKSAAFIIPTLLLSGVPDHIYYRHMKLERNDDKSSSEEKQQASKSKKKSSKSSSSPFSMGKKGSIRSLIVAPSTELAKQLHREVERLGRGRPGGLTAVLFSKSNASQVIAGSVGGKNGIDVLVSTPLRLVDAIQEGIDLSNIRIVVLDECDRLLGLSDGYHRHGTASIPTDDFNEVMTDDAAATANSTEKTFLAQMDKIFAALPTSSIRALFSATIPPYLKQLAETILRNPVYLRIANKGGQEGANSDITQELMFVGREEGKLLALRQMKEKGQLRPPTLVFTQSQDRAQALFTELLYDGVRVDVIHAGRSKNARDKAVMEFRQGKTWVLVCTDVVARGVDFRAVNTVINYDFPASAVTYIHRIGRTGRAGRKGTAVTLFTEADLGTLRTVANVMKQSGCNVEDWMLQLKAKPSSTKNKQNKNRRRRNDSKRYNNKRQKKK